MISPYDVETGRLLNELYGGGGLSSQTIDPNRFTVTAQKKSIKQQLFYFVIKSKEEF